ncbi:hypothetical protein ZIOFF_022651 [Zingiber officinale]|uniref:RNA ligase/cyclic nucleotide phosphodiesterase family protein n=1 Tax=Zingiber officinale TaxID=94328 RepID=A0A8J5HD61_ZINOF|nr:hypothetical protein ZIOFF_022651 [Zingiber officinale]
MDEAPAEAAKEVYSVWALPPGDVCDRIKRIMAALRSEFGGPRFKPHITVVGAISLAPDDALRRFRSACAALSRYPARVSAAAPGNFFFFIDPSPEAPYTPHLSLLYADLPDEVKEKARQRVEELDKEIAGVTFEVAALALWKTDTEDKSLESWEPVEVYQLPPNPK